MTCEFPVDSLLNFHFGAISWSERRAAEDHIVACSDCLREYLQLKRDVEQFEPVEVNELVRRATLAEAHALLYEKRKALRNQRLRWVAGVSIGVAAMAALLLIYLKETTKNHSQMLIDSARDVPVVDHFL